MRREMARFVKLFLLFCLHGLLFDYEQATCSSLSPSPSPSPSTSSPSPYDLLCSHSEKTALLQFKSLFGENPPALITWKDEASSDCCSWHGVYCDELTGHVTALLLEESNLHGAIPSNSTLYHLSHLQKLDLSGNDFNGSSISPAFGLSFPHLTDLRLSSSNFAGSVSWLTNLTELVSLDLSSNKLTGPIPTDLTKLESLDLSSNKLTGPIPTNISGLQKLTYLDLSNNLLSGTLPPDLFDIPMLVWVDLGFNRLSGPIPTTKRVQNSSPLRNVMLNDNNLPGSITGSIGRLSSLSQLGLSNNNLSGTLPPQLFLKFQQLENLDLSNNSFQGSLPQLPPSDMYYFAISHNKLEGGIPLSYCNFSMLAYLVLSHNNLSGVIPGCITNSSFQLQVLDLGINGFHGTIPDNFPKNNRVLSINLKGNRLEGKLPASLANCSELTVLDIGTNRIKDTFPYWLQSFPELEVLVLRNNKFHGPLGLIARTKEEIPFPKLRIFDLSRNEFIGPLPSNYFHTLSSLRNINRTAPKTWLYMGDTTWYIDTTEITLKGVDSELPRVLKIFAAIDLSDNNFEGEIPKDIGSLRGIQSLNLSHNALVGKIPSSLANLALLESLDLSSNQLSGAIPQEFTHLYFLEMLNLSSNLLTGQIPRGPQFNTFENDSYGGNSGLCGLPLSKKCSNENGTPSPGEQEEDDEGFFHAFTWKTVLLGYGCGTALGLGVGFVIFKTGRPKRLVTFVEDELLYMTTKRPRPAIVFLSEAQRRRRLRNSLS